METLGLIVSSLIGTGLGFKIGEKLRDKTLILKNKHRHSIWVVLMYKDNKHEDWVINGWYEIIPAHTFSYNFPGIKNRTVYYYAVCKKCRTRWGKGDTNGYVPTSYKAFTHLNSSHIGKIRNFTKVNLRDDDIKRNLTGF